MRVVILGVFLILLAACASSPDGTSIRPNVITEDQIAEWKELPLYDVVKRYHPEWLTISRFGGRALVNEDLEWLDTRGLSTAEYLRNTGTAGVLELEYLNEVQASARIFGGQRLLGAIIIRTKPRGRS